MATGSDRPRNQCQFCHPDATGSGGVGTGITNQRFTANGVYNVQASLQLRLLQLPLIHLR